MIFLTLNTHTTHTRTNIHTWIFNLIKGAHNLEQQTKFGPTQYHQNNTSVNRRKMCTLRMIELNKTCFDTT